VAVAAVGVAGVAQGVVGQLGQSAVSVNVSVTVPPGNPTKPIPVGADLARLIDLRHGLGLKAQAGNRLPAHGRAGGGLNRVAMQKPAMAARIRRLNRVLPLIVSSLD
jgi:hypothetical protein